MKIEAHLLHWQEKDIMPYVIRHYKNFCDEIIIHDNHSKDGSAEMAKELGCTVIPFGTDFFDDEINKDLKNECWKGSTADWVIVADFDEIVMIRNRMLNYFYDPVEIRFWFEDLEKDYTIFKTIGWQVMSEDWPVEKLTSITNGYRFDNYSKYICFSPKAIKEINYGPGAHECKPTGEVIWSDEGNLYVLHYKHIGGVQRTIDRYKILQKRLSKKNRQMGWGCHYNRSPASIRQEWNERMKISKPLI